MLNNKLIYAIWKLRKGSPQYCFPLGIHLGENGLIPNHELIGKTFISLDSGNEFVVENVYAHYYRGWYYMAMAHNSERSTALISWNINSEVKDIGNLKNYKLK